MAARAKKKIKKSLNDILRDAGQDSNDFTQKFLMRLSTKIAQIVPLYKTKRQPELNKGNLSNNINS